MLSKTSMHALRAVIFIARQPADAPVGAADIASNLGLPPNYLAKTLRRLAKSGVLESTRGRRGGFSLARPATHIAIADIIASLPGPVASPDCLLGGPCQPHDPCVAHARWAQWERELAALVKGTKVSDFLSGSGRGAPVRSPVLPGCVSPMTMESDR